MQEQINSGVIIPLQLSTAKYPIPALKKLSRGEWPTKEIDAKRGLWEMGDKSMWKNIDQNDTPGGYAIEGLTRVCELAKKALLDEQRSIGEPLQGIYEQQDEKFAYGSRGTIGAVQTILANATTNFKGLNCERVLWTGHQGKGKDERGIAAFGPATIGTAQVSSISGWFEITLHHDSFSYAAPTKANVRRQKSGARAWFERHPDSELPKIFWDAKIGTSTKLAALVLQYWEDGNIPLLMDAATGGYLQGLDTLLHLIDHGCLPGELAEQPVEVMEVVETETEVLETGEGSEDEPGVVQPQVEVEKKKGRR